MQFFYFLEISRNLQQKDEKFLSTSIINSNVLSFTFSSSEIGRMDSKGTKSVRFGSKLLKISILASACSLYSIYGVKLILFCITEGDEVQIKFEHEAQAAPNPASVKIYRRMHAGESPKAVSGSAKCVFWDSDSK